MEELEEEKANSQHSGKLLAESQKEIKRTNQVTLFTTYDNVFNHVLCVLRRHVY